ncbi:reverse transcriptase domain-containing protein [Tanacetum coccineum]
MAIHVGCGTEDSEVFGFCGKSTKNGRPRISIKGQILADFIVERLEDNSLATPMDVEEKLPDPQTLFTDESSCIDGSRAGLIFTNSKGMKFTYALRFRFNATNNEAEYEALIAGLRIAKKMGIKNLQTNVDSRLVENQVNGSYIVPRCENKMADALSKITSTSFAHLTKQVLVEELNEKSINEAEVLAVVEEEGHTWVTPIFEYLREETLHAKKGKARAVQPNYVLREIHEGSCNKHMGLRSVVVKAIQTGYYWPTMHEDARKMIREFQDCKVHCPVLRNPQQKLTPIMSSWPFYKWGINIAGPFPEGPGKFKFLIVAMDYFTKWIKAKLIETITGTTHLKICVKSYTSVSALPPLSTHKQTVWWKEQTSAWEKEYRHDRMKEAKIGLKKSHMKAEIDMVQNDEALEIKLYLLEERREQAAIREARSKTKMEKYYKSKFRNMSFKLGNLVYRNNDASHLKDSGKLSPKWEGPYEVTKALGKGAYKLRGRNGKLLLRTWNICNLKKCYMHEM